MQRYPIVSVLVHKIPGVQRAWIFDMSGVIESWPDASEFPEVMKVLAQATEQVAREGIVGSPRILNVIGEKGYYLVSPFGSGRYIGLLLSSEEARLGQAIFHVQRAIQEFSKAEVPVFRRLLESKVISVLAEGRVRDVIHRFSEKGGLLFQGHPPAMGVVFASISYPLDQLLAGLREVCPRTPFMACSSPGVFNEEGDRAQAAVLFSVYGDYLVYTGLGRGLREDPERAVREAIKGFPRQVEGYPYKTAIVLLDPLAGRSEEAVLLLHLELGEETLIAGGAAGDDLQMQTTYVGVNDVVATDAVGVMLVFSKKRLGVGVAHGHEPISMPLKVTRARENIVYEIDGKPAWQIWQEHTRPAAQQAGVILTDDDSSRGMYLLRYEAGLAVGESYKIRAPLKVTPEGGIQFACGIPEGSILRITEGRPETQISSVLRACQIAKASTGSPRAAGALVFDCICRKLILGDRFREAVYLMHRALGGVPIGGFETYGEIAMGIGDFSGFHNTTTVVLVFPS